MATETGPLVLLLATRKGGFQSYYDDVSEENTEPDAVALAQLADKKPCWSDETLLSGYGIPQGYLNANQSVTKPAAFVQGHPTVVRSLYATGICDFGATYVDARDFPSLLDEFPDLKEQVIVVRSQGHVYAFNLSGPHENTALKWLPRDNRFQCPKHHSQYQPTGEFITGRATRGMDRLGLKRDGSNITVDLDVLYKQDEDPAGWNAAMVKLA